MQETKILSHLKTGKSITPLEALDLCGCMRLSARILDLRKNGWPIHTTMTEHPSNPDCRFASYSLDPNKNTWPGAEQ
jgi:hypothetical protein